MAKRQSSDDQNVDAERPTKRPKVEESSDSDDTSLYTTLEVEKLFAFSPEAKVHIRGALKKIRVFLESTIDDHSQKKLLVEYLISSESEGHVPGVDNLLLAWRSAWKERAENRCGIIVKVLALLLRSISTSLESERLGLRICRTLLERENVKLFALLLAVKRVKEHVISPCLEALLEITTFGGGVCAGDVYTAKQFTFDEKLIELHLKSWRPPPKASAKRTDKPIVRRHAVNYVLAHIKFQSTRNKADIVSMRSVMRALLEPECLQNDSMSILEHILDTLKKSVLLDGSLSSVRKRQLLSTRNMLSVLHINLHKELELKELQQINHVAMQWLEFVCTDPRAGFMKANSSFYPPGVADRSKSQQDEMIGAPDGYIDLGLDSVEWHDKFYDEIPIRNRILADFAKNLHPYTNVHEFNLLISIFRACPELIAWYFQTKANIAFDPKLTSTWVGSCSLITQTLELHVERSPNEGYGAIIDIPPPCSIVLQNILPSPLDQKNLTRCLNQPSELVLFFACRLLEASLRKLKATLQRYKRLQHTFGTLWEESHDRILELYLARFPKLEDVFLVLKRTPPICQISREAISRLLSLYSRVIPQTTLERTLDVAQILTKKVKEMKYEVIQEEWSSHCGQNLRLLEIRNLIDFAQSSLGTDWFKRQSSGTISPFVALVEAAAISSHPGAAANLQNLLERLVARDKLFQTASRPSEFGIFVKSIALFESRSTVEETESLLQFLSDALQRLSNQTPKYFALFEKVLDELTLHVGLFWMVVVEQWPFASVRKEAKPVATWISLFWQGCCSIATDTTHLLKIWTKLDNADSASLLQDRRATVKNEFASSKHYMDEDQTLNVHDASPQSKVLPKTDISARDFDPATEKSVEAGLHQWKRKDLREAVGDGSLAKLFYCLSSEHDEVRKQARSNLRTVRSQLEGMTSRWPNAQQIWLLVGIYLNTESRKVQASELRLPFVCSAFAAHALSVVKDPLHELYPLMNHFLSRGPTWNVERLPSYWTQILLLDAPDELLESSARQQSLTHRASSNRALDWLLRYLYDALCTPEDLDTLRQRGTFEPLLVELGCNPTLRTSSTEDVLKLIWRATTIDGGSMTLLTRKGIATWIESFRASRPPRPSLPFHSARTDNLRDEDAMRSLLSQLWQTCDKDRIEAWSPECARNLGAVPAS